MTTIRDVARRAQVSVGTVSRVINDHPAVRPAVRHAVLQAIDELNYRPNQIARTLRTARTKTLGLVLSTFAAADTIGPGVWAAESVAQEHGYVLLLADSRFDREVEAQNIRKLLGRRIDGLLCNPVESSRYIANLVAGSSVPTVIFGWTVANPVLPTAVMDERAAIDEAIGHLVELGHRRIGVVMSGGPLGTGSPIRQRLIHQALRARGIEPDGGWDCVAVSRRECKEAVCELIQHPNGPTALVITASPLTPAVIGGVRAAGAGVSDDISLVCFGNSPWAEITTPPISVIDFDLGQQLRSASELLLGLIEGKTDLPHAIEQHARYVRRDSVRRAPGSQRSVLPTSYDSDSDAAK